MSLFVGNLAPGVDQAELEAKFKVFGRVNVNRKVGILLDD